MSMSYKERLSDLDRDGPQLGHRADRRRLRGRDRVRRARSRRAASAHPRARRARRRQPPHRRARLPQAGRAGTRLRARRQGHLRPPGGPGGRAQLARGRGGHGLAALRAARRGRDALRPDRRRDVPPRRPRRPDPAAGRLPVRRPLSRPSASRSIIADVAARRASRVHQYGEVEGVPELREQLAVLGREQGWADVRRTRSSPRPAPPRPWRSSAHGAAAPRRRRRRRVADASPAR